MREVQRKLQIKFYKKMQSVAFSIIYCIFIPDIFILQCFYNCFYLDIKVERFPNKVFLEKDDSRLFRLRKCDGLR